MNKLLNKPLKKFTQTMKKLCKRKNLPIVIFLFSILLALIIFHQNYLAKEGFSSTPHNLEKDVKDGKKLVLLYADWCGHCKKLKPDWDALSSEMNTNTQTKMIKVNVGENDEKSKEINEKYQLKGFPTIVLLDKGELVETYEGNRNIKSIKSFINSKF